MDKNKIQISFRKTAHPQNKSQGQGWEKTDKNDTLNVFDNSEGRTPTLIIENHPHDSRVRITDTFQTLSSRMDTGGGNTPMVKDTVVRRLTPLECERLQGFPTIREVKFTKMTKDEYIAYNLNEKNIIADVENGKVYATRGPGGFSLKTPKELQGTEIKGYKVISIRNGTTKMQCRVHRIIWIAAHGIIPEGYVIDHINNNKQDNRLCNLQLLTANENSTKAAKDGLYLTRENSPAAKLSNEVHDEIQYVYENTELTLRDLAKIYGISKSRIGQIIHETPWTLIGKPEEVTKTDYQIEYGQKIELDEDGDEILVEYEKSRKKIGVHKEIEYFYIDENGKKKKCSDSARYKALGNSIALPFWQWLAERMVSELNVDEPTMASLFDGIGGFPLVYSRVGCKPIWASEIEEFPIAVTKERFKD